MRRPGTQFIGELSGSQLLRWQSGALGVAQEILEEIRQAREASSRENQPDGGETDTPRHGSSSTPKPPTSDPRRVEDQT